MSQSSRVLEVRRLCAGPKSKNVDLDLRPGEIHGIAALQEWARFALPGLLRRNADLIWRAEGGRGRVHLSSPADSLHPSIGIGLLPEERKTQGLFLKLSGTINASLPVIGRFSNLGLLNLADERESARTAFSAVEVSDRALYTRAGAFSGGNQQKIAIAKWIMAESRILLLFDPTRGIDVGTKSELYALIRDFADAGGAVLLHSTEIPELVHLCDRVSVLYEGSVAAKLQGDEIDEVAVMRAALGGQRTEASSVRKIEFEQ